MFHVHSGKCVLRKAVRSWVEKFSQGRSKGANDETEVRTWLKRQSKDFCVAGFDALVKRWDECIECWWRICRELNVYFFPGSNIMFYVLHPFVTYLLSLPRNFIYCISSFLSLMFFHFLFSCPFHPILSFNYFPPYFFRPKLLQLIPLH
jgi:hypothetical protein